MFEGRTIVRVVLAVFLVFVLWNIAFLLPHGFNQSPEALQQCLPLNSSMGEKVEEEMPLPLLSTTPSTSFRGEWCLSLVDLL